MTRNATPSELGAVPLPRGPQVAAAGAHRQWWAPGVGVWVCAAAFGLAAGPLPVRAHGPSGGCHLHDRGDADRPAVAACARKRVAALVRAGKLPASWLQATEQPPQPHAGAAGPEWRVVLRHPQPLADGRDTLYLFYSVQGAFLAANFTGQ